MSGLPSSLPRLSSALTLAAGTLLAAPALAEAPQDTVHLTGIPYGADGACRPNEALPSSAPDRRVTGPTVTAWSIVVGL